MSFAHTSTDVPSYRTRSAVRVWDPLVRLFHWSLVIAFIAAFATGGEWEKLHVKIGYFVAGLVVFRLIWGLVGSEHARFRDFIYHPAMVISYLRDSAKMKAKRYIGHNPAGGAMVIALLASLSGVAVSGYMMTLDAFWGIGWVEDLHAITVNLTLGLLILHVAGVILASYEHKENLIKSMITGKKRR